MISHEHRCVFVHVRKNAGASILKSFAPHPDVPDLGYGTDGTMDPAWRTGLHPGYLTFAVARNPWSRFISGWLWLCRGHFAGSGNLGPDYYRSTPLAAILCEAPDLLPERCHDRRHLLWSHLDMLVDDGGRFVADEVLRFERLEDDYRRLCRLIDKPYRPLPRRNVGSARPYWTYYDLEARKLVGQLFAADIEHFGYRFDK